MNAMLSYVSESDLRLSGRLRGWAPPRWFRVWMIWATRLGDGWLWVSTAIFLAFGGSEYHRILSAVALSAGVTNILVVLLKRFFRRMRPGEYFPNKLLVNRLSLRCFAFDRFSFPSGHSMNAWAIATVLTLAFPAAGSLCCAFALSVGVSRIVLGQHFLSDVAVGSLMGALVGAASFYLVLG